jgi:hypothetical protein
MITQYKGIVGALLPQGSHQVAAILCAVSPISQLQVPGDDGPVLITPLEQCLATETSAPTPPEEVQTVMPQEEVETPPPTDTTSGSATWSQSTFSEFSSIFFMSMTLCVLAKS